MNEWLPGMTPEMIAERDRRIAAVEADDDPHACRGCLTECEECKTERERDELCAEAKRLRVAIEAHRARWQRANGINPGDARPADLELWAALEPATSREQP